MRKAILLVAYGAGGMQSRRALGRFEGRVRERFPGHVVRWAYSSLLLRERLARARQKSDSVFKALRRLCFEKFDAVAVQPLQTIPGREHGEVRDAVLTVGREMRVPVSIGAPLLSDAGDVARAASALLAGLPSERGGDEDVVFMGHGAKHAACGRYDDLARAVHGQDNHVYVGTMNGATQLADILPALRSKRVWLLPLLSTIGRHALADMAGRAPTSWLSRIEGQGHECRPVLKGTAEYDGIAEIWLEHLALAAEAISAAQGVSAEHGS